MENIKTRIERNFTYHSPKPGQAERYERLRAKAKEYALLVVSLTPTLCEQSLALTQIEDSVMWANASIARNEQEWETDPNTLYPQVLGGF